MNWDHAPPMKKLSSTLKFIPSLFAFPHWFFPSTALRPLSSAISPVIGSRLTMSSDQNFLPAASSSPFAHMSVKAFASSCVFMTSNPSLGPEPVLYRLHCDVSKATAGVTVRAAADALAKAHAQQLR